MFVSHLRKGRAYYRYIRDKGEGSCGSREEGKSNNGRRKGVGVGAETSSKLGRERCKFRGWWIGIRTVGNSSELPCRPYFIKLKSL